MKLQRKQSLPGPYASPWLVIAGTLVLGVAIVFTTFSNLNKDAQTMARILQEKGASLIKALEAGARTGMRGRFGAEMRLQVLVEELASQPDINFIMVTDHSGRVIAHSDSNAAGKRLFSPDDMRMLTPSGDVQWNEVLHDKQHAFLVYREFQPLLGRKELTEMLDDWWRQQNTARNGDAEDSVTGSNGSASGEESSLSSRPESPVAPRPNPPEGEPHMRPDHREGGWNSMNRMRGRMMGMHLNDPRNLLETLIKVEGPPPVIFVGLSIDSFRQAQDKDRKHMMLMVAILGLIGLGGVISLIWSRNAQRSWRMLADSQAFAGEVVSSLPDGLVVLNTDGTIALMNGMAEEQLGVRLAEVQGKMPGDVLPIEIAARLNELATSGMVLESEVECLLEGGACVPMGVSGSRILTGTGDHVGDILMLRDLREVRRLQDEVRRKEKLAAIGSLAAGVAHEIRNPLSSIKGYATYFGSRFEEGSTDRESARIMVQEVERLNRVITDLIGLARPSDVNGRPANIVEIAGNALRLLEHEAKAQHVELDLDVDETLSQRWDFWPMVKIDPDRISQAFLNICLNGIEAMPDGGHLTISMEPEGDSMVRISIADTGTGIPEDAISRIFDPYYTSKSQGTGLGLAIVHKIVTAHGGSIQAASGPDGTEFTILLPVEDGRSKTQEA